MAPAVYTIPLHRAFADALAAGLIARAGGDRMALARALVLLPNHRAARTLTEAFVRRSEGGLLLPRLVAIGDVDLDDRLGAALDPIGEAVPPAIEPVRRQLILARLVAEARQAQGQPVDAGEAMRLASDLARVLDQLVVEEIAPTRLREAVAEAALAVHWQSSLAVLQVILDQWPAELARLGRIDLAERRNRLLAATAARWATDPPAGLVAAAGITVAAPTVARLLRRVARLPQGLVVLPGLDLAMPDGEWQALGPGADAQGRAIAQETHPQFALKRLLDGLGVARGEVRTWRQGGGRDAPATRTRAVNNAFAVAAATAKWRDLPPRDRRLTGIRAIEVASPAEEAQVIALRLREVLETPERTAMLVTPDRALATRVSAHLARWGVAADDSAGRPLSRTPPGTLLLAIAEAAAERFAPVTLLALLKHPLVRAGDDRLAWLEQVRVLDRALRGPRPGAGLAGIAAHLAEDERDRPPARPIWDDLRPLLAALEAAFAGASATPGALVAAVREAATTLAGDAAWSRHDGRAAASLIAEVEAGAPEGPAAVAVETFPALLRALLDGVAVRPPQGGHPRLAILGLIEARLAQADLTIVAGLNEGVWPSAPAPDPWLAPAIRAALGLPGLERRIGIQAHDFATALGGREVLVTRARRDARAPAIASRFWLRLEAMSGGLPRARVWRRYAEGLDRPDRFQPVDRPRPAPPRVDRPTRIAVTKLDRLKADPFAFYADAMLKLRAWDAVDADPTPAWRGNAVHAVFEAWMKEDGCDPDRLPARAAAMLDRVAGHPVLRALWTPRLMEAIDWVAGEMRAHLAEGRRPLLAEVKGRAVVGGITLEGTVDRIDRLAGGGLAIVDYKTGKPPSNGAVAAGYALQLGLLGLIAERGGFGDAATAAAERFEYWSLAAGRDGLGYVQSPTAASRGQPAIAPADFTAMAARQLAEAAAKWLQGDEPFTAKLHPEYAPYGDYDQLMRLDEWYGRVGARP